MRGMQVADYTTKNTASGQSDPEAVIRALKEEVANLKQQLEWFKRQIFGRKSEKRLIDNPDQPDLLATLGQEATPANPEPTEKITYRRRKRKQRPGDCASEKGLRFGKDVPIEVIELSAPQLNGPDAEHYEVIDHKITRRLAQRPGSYVVLEYRRPVLRRKLDPTLMEVPAPTAIFEGCMADVSVLAGLLVDKFVYHLPLYRQHQRLKDAGIIVARSTLTHWVQRSIELLRPIYDAQLRHILGSKRLSMDETPIRAGRKKKGKMQSTWFWPIYGEDDEICFTWSRSRGRAHAEKQLEGFAGTLVSDGYAAYDAFARNKPQITLAQCWAHTRRYFVRAEGIEPKASAQALEMIGALYQVEEKLREQAAGPEQILKLRSQKSLPVVEQFFGWCYEQSQRPDLLPSNPLSKALTYVRNHQEQLKVYLGDPHVPIDTNHLERALRVIPMGRKNWLFCWSEAGAEQVGIIQSLLTTCRLQGVDPYTYLVDVLQRVGIHPAKDIIELMPRVWKEKFAANPMRSDLVLGDNSGLV